MTYNDRKIPIHACSLRVIGSSFVLFSIVQYCFKKSLMDRIKRTIACMMKNMEEVF